MNILPWNGQHEATGREHETDTGAPPRPLIVTDLIPGSPGREPSGDADRLILGDNQAVMAALLPDLRGRIDLIYIDPPFDLGTDQTVSVPIGDADADEPIEIVAYPDRWDRGSAAYARMMDSRLRLMRELLSDTGSLYVHCDYRAHPRLRLMLDEIFGADRLCNEIVWHYQSGGRQRKRFSMKHDTILWYTRSDRWTFNIEAIGRPRGTAKRNHMKRHVGADGRTFFTIKSAGKTYTYYEDDLLTPPDVWTDISHIQQKDPQRCGYPTQKPEALLERIILASSNEGDLVADFFCGSGTSGVVAERLHRRWLLCDQSRTAILAATRRLVQARTERQSAGHAVGDFELGCTAAEDVAGGSELYAELLLRDLRQIDVRLTGYRPRTGAWPAEARARIEQRNASAQLDLIEFWAVDFNWRPDRPFRHEWQAFRTRNHRGLPLESAACLELAGPSAGLICVKAIDALGHESRALIPRPDARSTPDSSRHTARA